MNISNMRKHILNYTQKNLKKYVKAKEIPKVNISCRDTLIVEPEYEEFNTCIEVPKMFDLVLELFINLTDEVRLEDLKETSKEIARAIVANIKKDMFQFGTIQAMLHEKNPDLPGEDLLKQSIMEFKDMRQNE